MRQTYLPLYIDFIHKAAPLLLGANQQTSTKSDDIFSQYSLNLEDWIGSGWQYHINVSKVEISFHIRVKTE